MVLKYETTADIKVPTKIVDQVIGQDEGLQIIKKAAKQRRNVLLIGEPGTGKSLLGQGMAELLPKEKLVDILCFHNDMDENSPLIRTMPKGKGKEFVNKLKIQSNVSVKNQNILFFILLIITIVTPWWIRKYYGDIMAAASLIGSMIFLGAFVLFTNLSRRLGGTQRVRVPKILVDNSEQEIAPFIDGTGAKAGALLADVLHDPLQSLLDSNKILTKNNKEIKITNLVNNLLKRHKDKIIKKGNYQAVYTTKKNNVFVLGEKNGKINDVEILSVNKYKFNGNLIKITTESGKEIIVTPDHKVSTKSILGTKIYKKAYKLKRGNKVYTT